MLFGIQQGGMFKDLREQSALCLNSIGFDGYAIGGLAVGESQEKMFEVLNYSTDFFPKDRPRYLMGVGKPSDIVGRCIERDRYVRLCNSHKIWQKWSSFRSRWDN